MNEALQKALLEILNGATAGLTAAKDFLSAEIPEVVHQLLMWKLFDNVLTALSCLLVIGAFVYCLVRAVKAFCQYAHFDSVFWNSTGAEEREARVHRDKASITGAVFGVPGFFLMLATLLGAIPCLLGSLREILQIWLAPKLYLIEYTAELAKKVAQ